jgi:hypothetical protein
MYYKKTFNKTLKVISFFPPPPPPNSFVGYSILDVLIYITDYIMSNNRRTVNGKFQKMFKEVGIF